MSHLITDGAHGGFRFGGTALHHKRHRSGEDGGGSVD